MVVVVVVVVVVVAVVVVVVAVVVVVVVVVVVAGGVVVVVVVGGVGVGVTGRGRGSISGSCGGMGVFRAFSAIRSTYIGTTLRPKCILFESFRNSGPQYSTLYSMSHIGTRSSANRATPQGEDSRRPALPARPGGQRRPWALVLGKAVKI